MAPVSAATDAVQPRHRRLCRLPFADPADVAVNTRLAADAVGATKMDRPEWASVNPKNGDVYLTLTNNNAANRPLQALTRPTPAPMARVESQRAHHRLREAGSDAAAATFRWDIYLFGAPATSDAANVNVSGLTAANDFSSPDGVCSIRRDLLDPDR